jgi:hypothetical protein
MCRAANALKDDAMLITGLLGLAKLNGLTPPYVPCPYTLTAPDACRNA